MAFLESTAVQSQPPELPDTAVAAAVSHGWKLAVRKATYQAVGYGSHHWLIEDANGGRWFTSVDRIAGPDPQHSFDRLAAALGAAATARGAGLGFVVAPIAMPDGGWLRLLPGGFALALYPYVDGRSGGFHDRLTAEEADELTGLLCSLHADSLAREVGAGGGIAVETFTIPGRRDLEQALAERSVSPAWSGLYGDRLRQLLGRHAGDVHRLLEHHDGLVAAAGSQVDRLVLTHGEPHPGNLIRTRAGLALIDWDTAMLAPPERDVWLLATRTSRPAGAEYAARGGRTLRPELLVRYELAWALADLADFVTLLRTAADRDADTEWSWEAFRDTVADLPSLLDRSHAPPS